jgi:hypothetical protein
LLGLVPGRGHRVIRQRLGPAGTGLARRGMIERDRDTSSPHRELGPPLTGREPHHPQVSRSHDETPLITIRPPRGEELQQHQLHERAYLLLADGEMEISQDSSCFETIKQWRARFAKPSVRKTLMKARLVPRYLKSREFRLAFTSGVSANSICFERELLDHFRLVFEKR